MTGPFKINGVPLKRVNSAYCIPTKTAVDIKGVNFKDINDDHFARDKVKNVKKSEDAFFATNPEDKTQE